MQAAPYVPLRRLEGGIGEDLDTEFFYYDDTTMRSTLKLDPDAAQRIEQEARQKGKTLNMVVNETLRAGLGLSRETPAVELFHVEPHSFGFRSDLDLDKMNQLFEELEAFEVSNPLRSDNPL
jgi:hypothetical protein